jgi:hypothetical protein
LLGQFASREELNSRLVIASRKDHRAKLAVDANFVDFLETGST